MEIYIPFLVKDKFSVSSKCLIEYISAKLGATHDFYIADNGASTDQLNMYLDRR